MIIKTKGIVLRRSALTAGDKSLILLTDELGQISVYARHTGSKKSRLAPCCDPFAYSEFCLNERNGRYTVDSAELLENFFSLRENMTALSLASYLLELVRHVMPGPENSKVVLKLLLNTLYFLEKGSKSEAFLKAVFELRLLSLLGFTPDLTTCCGCGEQNADGIWFLPLEGQVLCDGCFGKNIYEKYKIYLPPAVRKAAYFILTCEDKRLFSFTLNDAELKRLGEMTESFVLCHTGGKFTSLDFYKSLF